MPSAAVGPLACPVPPQHPLTLPDPASRPCTCTRTWPQMNMDAMPLRSSTGGSNLRELQERMQRLKAHEDQPRV